MKTWSVRREAFVVFGIMVAGVSMGCVSSSTYELAKSNAENALKHSRHLLADAYEEVKVKTRETGIATRDYAQDHPWTTAGVAVGALGLLAAYLLCKRD